jgi:hypothetical protein
MPELFLFDWRATGYMRKQCFVQRRNEERRKSSGFGCRVRQLIVVSGERLEAGVWLIFLGLG